MLYRPDSPNVNVSVISGRALRWLSQGQKAALLAQIVLGEVPPPKLSRRQLARIMGVPRPYALQAERLSAELRQAVRAGRYSLAIAATVLSDEKLEQTIQSAGVDRVWQALCKQL